MTSKDEIANRVREIFQKTVKIEPDRLQMDTVLRDELSLDSLDMIEVVYEVEDSFDVQIPEERVGQIRTFGEFSNQFLLMTFCHHYMSMMGKSFFSFDGDVVVPVT